MTSQTLAEAGKRVDNEIIQGVAEDIISVNPAFEMLPFYGFTGQSVDVNRENALGDVQTLAVGGTITAKAAPTYVKTNVAPTTIIGDVEMNGLVRVTSEGDGVDQMADEISSKAKSMGRTFRAGIATGTGSAPALNSYHSLADAGQYTTASAGQALSFALLDELLDLVKAKDGEVDFIEMAPRTLRAYRALQRALGGNTMEMVAMKSGRNVDAYNQIPIFKNDYLSVVETANGAALTGGALTSVWAGCWDDGTKKVGVSAIHPIAVPAGIVVEPVGKHSTKDEDIVRVKQYVNLALFNRKGLARLPSVNN